MYVCASHSGKQGLAADTRVCVVMAPLSIHHPDPGIRHNELPISLLLGYTFLATPLADGSVIDEDPRDILQTRYLPRKTPTLASGTRMSHLVFCTRCFEIPVPQGG